MMLHPRTPGAPVQASSDANPHAGVQRRKSSPTYRMCPTRSMRARAAIFSMASIRINELIIHRRSQIGDEYSNGSGRVAP